MVETASHQTLAMVACASSFMLIAALFTLKYRVPIKADTEKALGSSEARLSPNVALRKSFGRNTMTAELSSKTQLSPDCFMLEFTFQGAGAVVPVGKHLKVFCKNTKSSKESTWNGVPDPESGKLTVERKYTPIRSNDQGFTLMVKVYRPNEFYCDGGKVSQFLGDLQVGNTIETAMPFGIMEYVQPGTFRRSNQLVSVKHVCLLAGGSGITPIFRLLESALADFDDPTTFSLIYANRSQCDIVLRQELDAMQHAHPTRLRICYVLSKPPNNWSGEVGYITRDIIERYMPKPSDDILVLCCGPPPMIKTSCRANLDCLGYPNNRIWDF